MSAHHLHARTCEPDHLWPFERQAKNGWSDASADGETPGRNAFVGRHPKRNWRGRGFVPSQLLAGASTGAPGDKSLQISTFLTIFKIGPVVATHGLLGSTPGPLRRYAISIPPPNGVKLSRDLMRIPLVDRKPTSRGSLRLIDLQDIHKPRRDLAHLVTIALSNALEHGCLRDRGDADGDERGASADDRDYRRFAHSLCPPNSRSAHSGQ